MRTALAAAAAVVWNGAAGAQTLPPVEAFGRLPFATQVQLSPDGQHLAALQTLADGTEAAVIYPVEGGAEPRVFASKNWIVASVRWVKNDRAVMTERLDRIFGSGGGIIPMAHAMAIGPDSPDYVELFRKNPDAEFNTSTGVIVDRNLDDPNTVLMPLWTTGIAGDVRSGQRMSIYNVDVRTGTSRVLDAGNTLPGYWISDGHGTPVARVDLTRSPLVEHLLLPRGGKWERVRDFDGRADGGANVYGLMPDGTSLAVEARSPDGFYAIGTIDARSGADGSIVFSVPQYDTGAINDEWTGRVIGASYYADKAEFVFFEPAHKAVQTAAERLFPGETVSPYSMSVDGKRAVLRVEAPDQPPTYYLYDVAANTTQKLASEYPELKPRDLSQMTPYPYKARDGLDIHAYLTMPVGRPAKNLPVVVMPHGGPDARDYVHFDWWAQFLANRGYAVFRPNFRGSQGYGRAFNEAGHHQWGLKMQDDITDGVKKLIADGIADPKRICIVGDSYGGYAALAGATFTPELYACTVSVSGVSDLGRMLGQERARYGDKSQAYSFWQSRIGDESADAARLDATSPALHADQVRAPVLLMHGKLDTTVPYVQSEEEHDALVRAGKSVELVTFDGDDHYFSLARTRIQMLTAVEAFLKKYIG